MSLTRVDFSPQDFEDLINQKGYRLQWEQTVTCPCIDPATGRPVAGCTQCDSRGHFYYTSSQIKGVITRQNKEVEIGDVLGVLEPGDAFLTTSSKNKLSEWDRVINLDSLIVYSETLQHVDAEQDTLRFVPVGDVIVAITQSKRNAPIFTLKQNSDFLIDGNGKISWISNNKPANLQGVSFRYNHHPVWLVVSTPNYIRDTFVTQGEPTDTSVAMPIRVQIRLEQFGTATVGNQ